MCALFVKWHSGVPPLPETHSERAEKTQKTDRPCLRLSASCALSSALLHFKVCLLEKSVRGEMQRRRDMEGTTREKDPGDQGVKGDSWRNWELWKNWKKKLGFWFSKIQKKIFKLEKNEKFKKKIPETFFSKFLNFWFSERTTGIFWF